MPQEIELKIRLDSHEVIRQTLTSAGAVHVGLVRETNIFFDDQNASLRAKDSGLRVRLTTSAENPAPQALLTLKGPKGKDILQSREAFDITCAPSEQLIPLLNALGFQQRLLFEKDRDSWELDDCKIELDTLPALGTFLEIEGPSEQQVLAVQKRLNLVHHPLERKSYSHMVTERLKDQTIKELRF